MTKVTVDDHKGSLLIKIQSLYDIEHELTKALPKLAKASFDDELRDGFLEHLEDTKQHVKRLEEIFGILGEKPKKTKCEGIRGITEDGEWVTKVVAPDHVKDAMIASAARYAEHYEMAGYKSAILEATLMDYSDIVEILNQTLGEEEEADATLAAAMEKSLQAAE